MDRNNFGKIYINKTNLSKPICVDDEKVQSLGYTDHYINGVTYRVWSAFEGTEDVRKSLENLMLRRLESGQKVDYVADEFEQLTIQKDEMLMQAIH